MSGHRAFRGGAVGLVRYDLRMRLVRLWCGLRRRLPGSAGAPNAEPSVPFVHETSHHKSIHFSASETQSVMLKRAPGALIEDYTRTMMGFLAIHPRPRRIAMIGLGGGSLAKFCYAMLPHTAIDVVEVNPHVVALRDEFCVPPDDARFRVILDDGAAFLRHTAERYDVLLIDAYTRDGIPPHLTTSAFCHDCRRALHDSGVLVTNLYGGQAHRLIGLIEGIFPTSFFLSENGGENRVVFASPSPVLSSAGKFPLPASSTILLPVLTRVQAALTTAPATSSRHNEHG
jgi:spermidine synthase